MAKKTKFYVVWAGRKVGVYDSWAACKMQVDGFAGAKYKSYQTRTMAEAAFAQGYDLAPLKATAASSAPTKPSKSAAPQTNALCVDAACSGNPGRMEYRGVDLQTGKELFHMTYKQGTNNIGEFLAIVHGLALIQKNQLTYTEVYSDSRTAMGWVIAQRCKTQLTPSPQNQLLFEHIQRAEQWLKENMTKELPPIKKWDTENWGEIPADFGRK